MERFKQYKKTLIITLIVTLLPILIGVVLWDKLPDQIATHFGANGEPDGWSSKLFAVVGLPMFICAAQIVCFFGTLSDPKKQRIDSKVLKLILWICPVVSWLGAILSYGYSFGLKIDVNRLLSIFLGVVFIVIGNYLPKCRQNYTVGIKIPWTLYDEENWNQTHRIGGKAWVFAGVVVLILGVTGIGSSWMSMAVILVAAFVPMVYSYMYYMKHRKEDEI